MLQALVDGRVLCVHGGLSPDLRTLDQVQLLLDSGKPSKPFTVGLLMNDGEI